MLVLFFTGNGKVVHRSGDLDVLASTLSFSGVKSSTVSIRVDKLEDIVGDGLEAQISNYLDDEIMCVHFACVAANIRLLCFSLPLSTLASIAFTQPFHKLAFHPTA